VEKSSMALLLIEVKKVIMGRVVGSGLPML
jgi:hypothetical protein